MEGLTGVEIARDSLLTISGVALVTAVMVQQLIKPFLDQHKKKSWHRIALNLSTAALAVLLAYAGLYIFDRLGSGPDIVFATIQGVVAAAVATYGYENYKSVLTFLGRGGEGSD